MPALSPIDSFGGTPKDAGETPALPRSKGRASEAMFRPLFMKKFTDSGDKQVIEGCVFWPTSTLRGDLPTNCAAPLTCWVKVWRLPLIKSLPWNGIEYLSGSGWSCVGRGQISG